MPSFISATTALLMAYAIYEVFQSIRLPRKPHVSAVQGISPSAPLRATQPATPVVSTSAPTPAPVAAPPVVSADSAARKRPQATGSADRGAIMVRDPASGEVIAMPTNYRFAKKWIKDALVSEGLLDKVYKPNELDEAASLRTKEALDRFKTLPKYQV